MSSPVTQSAPLAAEHDVGPGLSCGAPDNIHSEVVILTGGHVLEVLLPEQQHQGRQKCSEIVVPLNVLGRVKGQISKHLDNVNIQL